MQPETRNLQQGIGNLINIINPYDTSSHTKNAILLTSLTNPKITLSLTSLNQPSKNKQDNESNSRSKRPTDNNPQIYSISHQLATTVINTKNCLFSGSNDYPLNLLYFLAIYENVKVMYVILNEDSIEDEIVNICQSITNVFKNESGNGEVKKFIKSIGIVIQNVLDLNQTGKYVDYCKKAKQSGKLDKDKHKLGIQLLNQIIQEQKVILSNIKKPIKQFISNHQKIPNFKASPQALTILYKSLFNPTQLSKLQKQAQQNYKQKSTQFLNTIKQAIENKQIFNEVPEQRKSAVEGEIVNNIPLGITFSNLSSDNLKKGRPLEQFAIQAAYFILVSLYNYEEEFYKLSNTEGYVNNNAKNDDSQWYQFQISNLSVVGSILQKIFSTKTIYSNLQILSLAKYFHIVFRVLENVPDIKLREHEQKHIQVVHFIIQKLIQFFYEYLNERVEQVTKNNIMPVRLINLTDDIKQLINFLQKLLKIKRKPYLDLALDIKDRIVYIVSAFFFCAWRCYEIYKNFWNQEQKNLFMLDLETIFRNQQYMDYFLTNHKTQASKIAKKINQYFGDLCFKKQLYYFAAKFYTTGRINSKLIKTYNTWFQIILQSQILNTNNIHTGILKLAELGLIQQARKWCYKFMDIIDENSEFISLLEDIADIGKIENEKIMQQIAKLKYDEINIVDKDIMEVFKKDLDYQDWLCRND